MGVGVRGGMMLGLAVGSSESKEGDDGWGMAMERSCGCVSDDRHSCEPKGGEEPVMGIVSEGVHSGTMRWWS